MLGTNATIGSLSIDGVFFCHTLEDPVRDEKIYGKTAIPTGTYKVVITMSPRFKRELPLLLDVPNYQGVRIHPGNTADDTEGCILVGNLLKDDFITNSRKTFNSLLERMKQTKEITIEIS
jgi:hypothetical protein